MNGNAYTEAEGAWLRENYGKSDTNGTIDAFEREFGRRPSAQSLFVKAYKMGIYKSKRAEEACRKAPKIMRWTSPKFEREREWMLANDAGNYIFDTIDKFEAEFGIRLTIHQITRFRSTYGTQIRRSCVGGRSKVPVGTERPYKNDYIIVKVAEESDRPQGKTNWKLKHVHIWEQANGPLPKDHDVLFVDRDKRNFDPDNLVAVPRRYKAVLMDYEWYDRETFEVAINCTRLRLAVTDAKNRPRPCKVCGKTFEPTGYSRYQKTNTCPECLAMGRKSYERRGVGTATCVVCGREFTKIRKNNRRCSACVAEKPKWSADKHAAFVRKGL